MPRSPRRRTVLLMFEYSCEYSPLWSRSDDLEIGPVDAADLGLDGAVREDLAAWNRRLDTAGMAEIEGRPAPVDVPRPPEAFALAARVQRGLGDAWTVWCCGGGGDGGLRGDGWSARRRQGTVLLLDRGGLHDWSPDGADPAADLLEPETQEAVRAWTASAERLMPGEHRARALELCGRLQDALLGTTLLWFGGEDVPD